ncbi:hypothetical protein [Scytonema sp. NUACC26]
MKLFDDNAFNSLSPSVISFKKNCYSLKKKYKPKYSQAIASLIDDLI